MLALGSIVIEIGLHIWLWASWWTSEKGNRFTPGFLYPKGRCLAAPHGKHSFNWYLELKEIPPSHQLHGCSQSSVSPNVKWGDETLLLCLADCGHMYLCIPGV